MADLEKISSGVISGDDAGVAELTQKRSMRG